MTASSVGLSNTSAIKLATSLASSSLKPRVVIAGEPIRMPEVTNGLSGSLGIEFLFTVMCAKPKAASAALPVQPLGRKSTKNTCDSVRPEIMRKPRFANSSAITLAFFNTCVW